MPILKLGRRSVSSLPAVSKPTIFYDSDLKGFGIKAMPTGAQSWIVEYRPGEGGRGVQKRRMVIGTPSTLSPEKAREAAERLLAEVKLGGDPAAERAKARRADTVNDILDAYIREHATPHLKASSTDLLKIYFDKHIRPAIGHKKSTTIAKGDVANLHRAIGKTLPVTANRAIVALKAAYNHAIEHGSIPETIKNPAAGIKMFDEQPRERYLTEEELQRLGDTLREAETTGLPMLSTRPSSRSTPGRRKTVSPRLISMRQRQSAYCSSPAVDYGKSCTSAGPSMTQVAGCSSCPPAKPDERLLCCPRPQ